MSLFEVAARRASKGGLDKPAAALAALAAAALVFLVPAYLIESLIVKSGIAAVFPPLDPPLGFKARAGLSLVAAGFTFGFIMTLMKLIDRFSRRRPVEEPEASYAPRVRRRDRHPDAPVRAPFSVARDMEAFDEPAPAEPAAEVAQPQPKAKPQPAPEPVAQSHSPRRRAPLTSILAGEVEPEPAPPPVPEPTPAERLRRIRPGRAEAGEEPAPEPVAAPAEEELVLAQREVIQDEPVAPAPAEPDPEQSVFHERQLPFGRRAEDRLANETLPELLARLERAMRQRKVPAASEPEAAPVEDEAIDTRLRSALENLKRFAPRAG